jgi:Holliday junction resolvase RusA-like endonuclease
MIIHLGHLPDRDLSPNKRLHHMALYKAKVAAKEEMYCRVLEQGRPIVPFTQAHITITWVAKDKRRRDIDNLFASMKSYIDGLVFADVLVDDSADLVSYTLRYERGDKDDTVIEIKERANGIHDSQ